MTGKPLARLENNGPIALLTLDRPEAMNALNRELVRQIRAAIAEVEADTRVQVLVIASSSPRAFCAGIDLRERQSLSDQDAATYREHELFPMYAELEAMRKPKIAAVSGHSLAGGFELAMTADMILASPDASFALTEVKWGVIPAAGGAHRLTRILGPFRAKEYILTAKAMSAQEAAGFGIVNRVVPLEGLLDAAMTLAADVASRPQGAVQRAKLCIDNAFGLQETAAFALHVANENYFSETRKSGMAAFGRES